MPILRPALSLFLGAMAALCHAASPSGLRPLQVHEPVHLGASLESPRQVMKLGSLELSFEPGAMAQVMQADRQVGIHYQGKVRMTYLSRDPLEHSVLAFNLKANTSLAPRKTPEGLALEETFESLTLWGLGWQLPATPADAPKGADLSAGFEKQQATFRRLQATPWQHLLAVHGSPGAQQPVAVMHASAKSRPWLYLHDGVVEQKESLQVLRSETYDGQVFATQVRISEQFLGRSLRSLPLAPWLLTHLDLDLEASKSAFATLKVTETYTPLRPGLDTLCLDLVSHRLAEGRGMDAISKYSTRLLKVLSESGAELPFHHQDHSLVVRLAQPTAAQVPVKLTFHLEGDMLPFHKDDNYWDLSLADWYPNPGRTRTLATVNARIKVPSPFVPLCGGEVLRREEKDGINLLEVKFDKPISLFAAIAGNYKIKSVTQDGLTLRAAGYGGLSANSDRLLKAAFSVIRQYEHFLGPFPFKELQFVERNNYGEAQAPAGLIYLPKEAFNTHENHLTQFLAAAWINNGLAHEIAHQWWGTAVKIAREEDTWIEESLATFCAALSTLYTEGKGKPHFEKLLRTWQFEAGKAKDASSIFMANRLRPTKYGNGDDLRYRNNLVYEKGALVFARIYREIGEEKFLTFLRTYQKHAAWRMTTTADVARFLKVVTGKDHLPLLERTVWGTEMP